MKCLAKGSWFFVAFTVLMGCSKSFMIPDNAVSGTWKTACIEAGNPRQRGNLSRKIVLNAVGTNEMTAVVSNFVDANCGTPYSSVEYRFSVENGSVPFQRLANNSFEKTLQLRSVSLTARVADALTQLEADIRAHNPTFDGQGLVRGVPLDVTNRAPRYARGATKCKFTFQYYRNSEDASNGNSDPRAALVDFVQRLSERDGFLIIDSARYDRE